MKEPFHKSFVIFSVLNCGISFAQWGYFFTLFNTLQSHFQNYVFPDATVNEISMIGSGPNFGGAIAVLFAESLVSKFGRWKTMVLTDIICLFGVVLTMFASLPILVAGRTVVGFAIGLSSVAVPLYITEMTPVEYRGATGVFPAIGSCITRILSYMAGFLLPTHLEPGETDNSWRFLLAIPAIFNVIRLVNLFVFLKFDTPFQLVMERKEEEAKMVLAKIYKENIEAKYEHLVEEANYMASANKVQFSDLFSPKFRRAFLLGVVVSVIEQACGVNVVYMFSNTIFETGLSPEDPLPKILTTMVGFLALVFTVMAYFWLQRRGRKPLMVIGLIAMGIVDIAFAAIGYIDSIANPAAKVLILVWIAFFTWSFGSVMFLYLSECLPDKGFSVTILLNWILAFVVVQVTMSVAMWIGFDGSFLAFGLLSFFGAGLIHKHLIESKGKTKLQILKEYCAKDHPAMAATAQNASMSIEDLDEKTAPSPMIFSAGIPATPKLGNIDVQADLSLIGPNFDDNIDSEKKPDVSQQDIESKSHGVPTGNYDPFIKAPADDSSSEAETNAGGTVITLQEGTSNRDSQKSLGSMRDESLASEIMSAALSGMTDMVHKIQHKAKNYIEETPKH